jgi:putative NIF3 family GTP cyclohydrolase 1 type 2
VALITGSGGDGLEKAITAGADAFLTADLRHDRFLAAEGRILLADIGHYESEFCAIGLIIEQIRKKFTIFAVRPSANSTNPVNYLT